MRTAAGFHARDPAGRKRGLADEEFGVLGAIDVIGHDRHGVSVTKSLAETQAKHRLAGADRAADTDTRNASG
jgi:hypothetical protein